MAINYISFGLLLGLSFASFVDKDYKSALILFVLGCLNIPFFFIC